MSDEMKPGATAARACVGSPSLHIMADCLVHNYTENLILSPYLQYIYILKLYNIVHLFEIRKNRMLWLENA